MGTSQREAEASADLLLLKIARERPLQTLTERELQLDIAPLTIYPKPVQARAWIRFGDIPAHVECLIHRSTPDAAGISFTIRDKTFRCWVWGNAITATAPESPDPPPGAGPRA